MSWKVIEKNENDIICEWIVHKPYDNVYPRHEIIRGILTENGFHRIGFTRKNCNITTEEKEKWVKLLKTASVVSLKEASHCPDTLSLGIRAKCSLELGPNFQNWNIRNTHQFEEGYSVTCHVPPSYTKETYVMECLEVTMMPMLGKMKIDQFFEMEKQIIEKQSSGKVKFQVFKKSPEQIIYSYSHPKDGLRLNAIVKAVALEQGYCSICYKKGLFDEMKDTEQLKWVDKLGTIVIHK